jgi:hypothetical protein
MGHLDRLAARLRARLNAIEQRRFDQIEGLADLWPSIATDRDEAMRGSPDYGEWWALSHLNEQMRRTLGAV